MLEEGRRQRRAGNRPRLSPKLRQRLHRHPDHGMGRHVAADGPGHAISNGSLRRPQDDLRFVRACPLQPAPCSGPMPRRHGVRSPGGGATVLLMRRLQTTRILSLTSPSPRRPTPQGPAASTPPRGAAGGADTDGEAMWQLWYWKMPRPVNIALSHPNLLLSHHENGSENRQVATGTGMPFSVDSYLSSLSQGRSLRNLIHFGAGGDAGPTLNIGPEGCTGLLPRGFFFCNRRPGLVR